MTLFQADTLFYTDGAINAAPAFLVNLESEPQQASTTQNLVFIDSAVADLEQLIAGIKAAEIVVLDEQQDGILQITQTLANYQNLDSVHVLSHGRHSDILLGNASLNAETIGHYANELESWNDALNASADILIYGCNVASGSDSLDFVETLSKLTNADIAASNDVTGNSDLGGDWQLEVTTGSIEADLALHSAVMTNYAAVLDISSEDLVMQLQFNETNGTLAADSSINGSNNNGTLVNGASFRTEGEPFGGVVDFDGLDDYVAVADSTDINLDNYAQRTVSLWFQVDDVTVAERKQVIYEEGGGSRGLNIYVEDGQLYVGGWNFPESGWTGTYLSTNTISSNTWHNVTLVLDAVPESTTIQPEVFTAYLDGVQFGQGDGTQLWLHGANIGLGAVNGDTRFHDGYVGGTAIATLAGSIADARVYNRAVTAAEITILADPNNLLNTSPPEPVMHLRLDETTGTQALDSSTQGLDNPGTLTNGAVFEAVGGDLGNAVRFDGVDDFIAVNNSTDINLDIHAQRTITIWFNAEDIATSGKQVLYEEGAGIRGLNIYLDNSQLYVGGWNEPESSWAGTYLSTDNISSNTWHHVALVLDAVAGNTTVQSGAFRAYLDGVEFGQGAGSQLWSHSGDIHIGDHGNTQFHDGDVEGGIMGGFAGTIADVRLYNQVLTADSIAELASIQLPGGSQGLTFQTFTDLASWQAAVAGLSTTLEDFNNQTIGYFSDPFNELAFNGFSLSGNSNGDSRDSIGIREGNAPGTINGTPFIGWIGAGMGPTFEVNFNNPVVAFAFEWRDFDTSDSYHLEISDTIWVAPPFTVAPIGNTGVSGGTGCGENGELCRGFFGVLALDGTFTEANFVHDFVATGDTFLNNFGVDNFRIATNLT